MPEENALNSVEQQFCLMFGDPLSRGLLLY